MSPALASGEPERGGGGAPLEYHVLIFLGLLLGGANMEKRGDDQERTFFLANTVQVHFV